MGRKLTWYFNRGRKDIFHLSVGGTQNLEVVGKIRQ